MTQTQKYEIKPNGVVKGGVASYTADFDTGLLTYSAQVQIGFLIFSKTYNYNGSFTLPVDLLKSETVTENDGSHIVYNNMKLSIFRIQGDASEAFLEVVGQDLSGTVTFDTSNPFLQISQASFVLKTNGITANIQLVENHLATEPSQVFLKAVYQWQNLLQ